MKCQWQPHPEGCKVGTSSSLWSSGQQTRHAQEPVDESPTLGSKPQSTSQCQSDTHPLDWSCPISCHHHLSSPSGAQLPGAPGLYLPWRPAEPPVIAFRPHELLGTAIHPRSPEDNARKEMNGRRPRRINNKKKNREEMSLDESRRWKHCGWRLFRGFEFILFPNLSSCSGRK